MGTSVFAAIRPRLEGFKTTGAAERHRGMIANLNQNSRVGMLFSGGPAPAANRVMHSVVGEVLEDQGKVIGFHSGYKNMVEFIPEAGSSPSLTLVEGEHYETFNSVVSPAYEELKSVAEQGGVYLGTSRENPGKKVRVRVDLEDPAKAGPMLSVIRTMMEMGIGALVSIGGDDTLTTAYKLHLMGVPVVHVPKTIDRDLPGVENTFGFDTVVEGIGREIASLKRDAAATGTWYVVEAMGRKAGWIALDSALRGGADRVLILESLQAEGLLNYQSRLDLSLLSQKLSPLLQDKSRKGGVIVLSEGLAEFLPDELLPMGTDTFGHLKLRDAKIGGLVRKLLQETAGKKTEEIVMGYAYRCAHPTPFDVNLGQQYGIEAARLLLRGEFGRMANGSGGGIDFEQLVDPERLRVLVRLVEPSHPLYQAAVQRGLIQPV